jgi:hypothetical protein
MTREDHARELVKGLDGLAMLNEWALTLVKDLRERAESLVDAERTRTGGPVAGQSAGESASGAPDCGDKPPDPGV